MEQVFIIIAVLVFWIFKGVARAQRRVPGQDPYESEPLSPVGHPEVAGTTRRGTAITEAQERAIEALRRWEEKQGHSSGQDVSRRDESVPAASRTRVGRSTTFLGRAEERLRKQAYGDIAHMLDPSRQGERTAALRVRSSVETPVPAAPPAARETGARTPETRDDRPSRPVAPKPARPEPAERGHSTTSPDADRRSSRSSTRGALSRIEALPLAARAIVYTEIFGRPRYLS
jgi:hypothetical protein